MSGRDRRPVVGLTTRVRPIAASFGAQTHHTLTCHYSAAVRDAGGVPVLLVPVPGADVEALADRVDALVLTGGGDVAPELYGGAPHPSVYDVDPSRDELELELVRLARERELPLLAICRGTQLLNVALGGDLVVDLGSQLDGPLPHRPVNGAAPTHRVTLDPTSRAAALLGTAEVDVNSCHHQAVRNTAPGLRAAGWAGDGVTEVVEGEDERWFVLGVQWHPEQPEPDGPARSRPFEALVEAAAQRLLRRSSSRARRRRASVDAR